MCKLVLRSFPPTQSHLRPHQSLTSTQRSKGRIHKWKLNINKVEKTTEGELAKQNKEVVGITPFEKHKRTGSQQNQVESFDKIESSSGDRKHSRQRNLEGELDLHAGKARQSNNLKLKLRHLSLRKNGGPRGLELCNSSVLWDNEKIVYRTPNPY